MAATMEAAMFILFNSMHVCAHVHAYVYVCMHVPTCMGGAPPTQTPTPQPGYPPNQ